MIHHARAGQVAYGYAIGMLCAEWNIPFVPGDLNNANTFPFPIRYETVPQYVRPTQVPRLICDPSKFVACYRPAILSN